MKIFLAIKYYEDMRNRDLIENICQKVKNSGNEIFVFVKNIQNYKKCITTPEKTMRIAFENILKSDIFIIEASEPSIGIGIESGLAYVHGKPIYILASPDTEVSNSIIGISKDKIVHHSIEGIISNFRN